jgi:hypothetical protein
MFTHLDVAAVRAQARKVLRSIPGPIPNARPAKGNPDWPSYELADAVIKLCDFVEQLRVGAEA